MSSGEKGLAIEKVRYSHDAMIDVLIAQPMVSQNELAVYFGYTPGWVSQVMAADAFKARLAERKGQLVDPVIAASVNEMLESLARDSIAILKEALHTKRSGDLAVKALEVSSRALGYGARDPQVLIQQSFVAVMPAKEKSVEAWENIYVPAAAMPRVFNGAVINLDSHIPETQ